MTAWLHPRRRLLLLAEGRLDGAAGRRVESHLAACAECRARLERIRTSIARLEAWPVEAAAPPLDLRRVATAPGERPAAVPRAAVAIAASVVLALAVLLVLRWSAKERLDLLRASGEPSAFERLALAEHGELRRDVPVLSLASSSALEIRRWLREEGGFSADLLAQRPQPTPTFQLLGARGAHAGPLAAAAVALRIDQGAVTLLVGHASEVDGVPDWTPLSKRLQLRRDPATGAHLLSWKNAGKAYTLVTDPTVPPRLACQLCHVQPRRLATIERVAGEL